MTLGRKLTLKNTYKVVYRKAAKKFLDKNHKYGIRFVKNFAELAQDFKNNYKNFDIEVYNSIENSFRTRIGGFRAIFQIFDNEIKIIEVINIGSRGDIYKK